MALACHLTNHHLQVFAQTGYQSRVVVVVGERRLAASDLCPLGARGQVPRGFIFTLLLHLLQMCPCVQGSNDEATGDDGRDSEDGHLIYKSGDVIKDQCTSQFDHTVDAPQGSQQPDSDNLLFRPDRGHVGRGNLWEGGAVFGP